MFGMAATELSIIYCAVHLTLSWKQLLYRFCLSTPLSPLCLCLSVPKPALHYSVPSQADKTPTEAERNLQ